MVLLGPAVAFVAAYGLKKGVAPFEKTLLAVVWVTPLLARVVAKLSHIPLGPMVMLALFAFTILRARNECLAHHRELLAPARIR
jgi:alpha-1,2-mannosyltransferase